MTEQTTAKPADAVEQALEKTAYHIGQLYEETGRMPEEMESVRLFRSYALRLGINQVSANQANLMGAVAILCVEVGLLPEGLANEVRQAMASFTKTIISVYGDLK